MSSTTVENGVVIDAELKQEALTIRQQADACQIETHVAYVAVADRLKIIKTLQRRAVEFFKPMKQQADALKKSILEREKTVLDPLAYAESKFKSAMASWDAEQERKRIAEEQRLQELARKQAEKEAEKAAKRAEKAGDAETAEAIRSAPVEAPVVVVAKETPKVEGVSFREVWKFRIVDAAKVPAEYLMPNEVAIGQVVRALKGNTKIAGVEVYAEKSVATRA